MLPGAKMIGFILTTDYDRACSFYVDQLQFQFVSLDQYALVTRCGENMVRIVKVPQFSPAQATVMGWEVTDIEAALKWLKARGITFESYPFMRGKQVMTFPNGDQVAWFKDPDGNTLRVSHHV